MTTFSDFMSEYGLLIILGAIIVSIIIYKNVKRMIDMKKISAMKPPVPKKVDNLDDLPMFTDVFTEKQKNIQSNFSGVDNFEKVFNQIKADSEKLDNLGKNDFEFWRNELQTVHLRRDLIKQYGIELGKIYNKYKTREYQISLIMSTIENQDKDQIAQ
jgi:hypothetical protein